VAGYLRPSPSPFRDEKEKLRHLEGLTVEELQRKARKRGQIRAGSWGGSGVSHVDGREGGREGGVTPKGGYGGEGGRDGGLSVWASLEEMAVSFAPVNNTSKRPLAPVPLEKGGMPWQSVLATKGALAALDQAADRLLPPVLPRGLRGKGGVDDVEELTRTQPLQWSHVLGQFQVVPCSNGQAGSSLQPALPPALFAVEGRKEGLEAGRVEGEAGVTRTRSRRAMSRGERGEADRGNGLGSLEGRPKASGVTGATEREDGNEEREADSCNPEGDFPLSLVQSEIPAPTFRRLDSPEAAVEGGEGREREEGREEKEGEEEGEEEEEEDISDEAILARHEETLKQIWERYARWRELRKRQRPPPPHRSTHGHHHSSSSALSSLSASKNTSRRRQRNGRVRRKTVGAAAAAVAAAAAAAAAATGVGSHPVEENEGSAEVESAGEKVEEGGEGRTEVTSSSLVGVVGQEGKEEGQEERKEEEGKQGEGEETPVLLGSPPSSTSSSISASISEEGRECGEEGEENSVSSSSSSTSSLSGREVAGREARRMENSKRRRIMLREEGSEEGRARGRADSRELKISSVRASQPQ